MVSTTVQLVSPYSGEEAIMYWWYLYSTNSIHQQYWISSLVLMVSFDSADGIHDKSDGIPHSTEHPPQYWTSPTVLNIPINVAQTFPGVILQKFAAVRILNYDKKLFLVAISLMRLVAKSTIRMCRCSQRIKIKTRSLAKWIKNQAYKTFLYG